MISGTSAPRVIHSSVISSSSPVLERGRSARLTHSTSGLSFSNSRPHGSPSALRRRELADDDVPSISTAEMYRAVGRSTTMASICLVSRACLAGVVVVHERVASGWMTSVTNVEAGRAGGDAERRPSGRRPIVGARRRASRRSRGSPGCRRSTGLKLTTCSRARRDRVLLEVEVEVLRAGLDRRLERRAHPRRPGRRRSPSRRRRRRRRRPRSPRRSSGRRRSRTAGTPARRWRSSARRRRASCPRRSAAGSWDDLDRGPSCRGAVVPPPRRPGRRRRWPRWSGAGRVVVVVPPQAAPGHRGRHGTLVVRRIAVPGPVRVVRVTVAPERIVSDPTLTMRRFRLMSQPCDDRAENRVLDAAKALLRALGLRQGHDRRHRRRGRRVAGDDLPHVPRRQGRAVRGAAGPRAGGVLHRPAGRVEGPTRSRSCSCAHRRRGHPGAARRRAPRADAGLRAGRPASQLTVEGVPRIIRFATAFLAPLVEPYLAREAAAPSSTCSPG